MHLSYKEEWLRALKTKIKSHSHVLLCAVLFTSHKKTLKALDLKNIEMKIQIFNVCVDCMACLFCFP